MKVIKYILILFFLAFLVSCSKEARIKRVINSDDAVGLTDYLESGVDTEFEFSDLSDIEYFPPLELGLIHYAARRGSYNCIKLLIDKGADVNALDVEKHNALFYCVIHYSDFPDAEHYKSYKLLVETGIDINQADVQGRRPLDHILIYKRDKKYLEFLLSREDLEIFNSKGQTPLHIITENKVKHSYVDNVLALFDVPNLINQKDDQGNTVLHYCCADPSSQYKLNRLKNWLEMGADVNIQNNNNETALHVLLKNSEYKNPEFAKLLLDKGADLTLKDKKGNTVKSLLQGRNPNLIKD